MPNIVMRSDKLYPDLLQCMKMFFDELICHNFLRVLLKVISVADNTLYVISATHNVLTWCNEIWGYAIMYCGYY